MKQTKLFKTEEFREKFNELFNLSTILNQCIFLDEESIEKLSINIPLTKLGQKRFLRLSKKFNTINPNLIKLALFIDFYHENFYINISEINIQAFENQISKLIFNKSICYPWIYGRELYDKYFTDFESQEVELDYNQTVLLLENTLMGVFQVDEKIISPFGIIKSKVKREIFPTTKMYLWHCSDPSCSTFHITKLNKYSDDSKISLILDELSVICRKKQSLEIDLYTNYEVDENYFEPNNLDGLYDLLANAFSTEEHKAILERIIEKEDIRSLLPTNLQKGSAKSIVKNLCKDQCFSLLLIMDNLTLLKHTESLIDENIISIPNTEIRQSNLNLGFGQYQSYLQCSKLGFRVNSHHSDLSVTRLTKIIKDANSDDAYANLEWKLRNSCTTFDLDQKIRDYIFNQSPINVIKETIYCGHIQLKKAFEALPGFFELPNNEEEEITLFEKIAWKLGFNINLFPTFINSFWNHLTQFKNEVLILNKYTESDKASIRSSAVNLFVSMEEILQQSLSFVTWMLLSDHYMDTQFSYVYEDARSFMISKLDNFEYSENKYLKFDESGKNTLFPLVTGFNALIKICDLAIMNSEQYKREIGEFPSFYNHDPLKIFPFEHKLLILDIKHSDYTLLKDAIESIESSFGNGKILDIRNRLQHNRKDFPNQEEMLNAINEIETSFLKLEKQGLYPNVCLFEKLVIDEYKRTNVSVKNYKGNSITFYTTHELDGIQTPNVFQPAIVIDTILIGRSNYPLSFQYKEKSKYQSYWKDYPLKKR